MVRARQVGGRRPAASGQHGWQLGPRGYLGAVLSHGVVVEASALDLNCFRQC